MFVRVRLDASLILLDRVELQRDRQELNRRWQKLRLLFYFAEIFTQDKFYAKEIFT